MIVIKKVLVLYTGGTIGMQKNRHHVYALEKGKFLQKIKSIDVLNDEEKRKEFQLSENQLIIPKIYEKVTLIYAIKEYDPILDSSNMSVKDWLRIAQDIEDEYGNYDGFVVLHGTDTIAFTASALSFIFENLNKPIILTGSQIPIFETRNDAKDNFLTSLVLSSCFDITEVCIYFSNKLFRGNRSRKVNSNMLEAFDSPNCHTLADCGIQIKLHRRHLLKRSGNNERLKVNKNLSQHVAVFRLFPTVTSEMLKSFFKPPLEGVVLETYGTGNIQSERKDILQTIRDAVDNGVIVVNVTQCMQGSVNTEYAAGKVLNDIGVLAGYDITPEAALCKLSYVLGLNNKTLEEKRQMMITNLRGEMTTPHD